MDKDISAHPEGEGGDRHQDSGNPEGQMWAVPLQQPGGQQGRQEGTGIDGEVEPTKCLGQEVGILDSKLISDVGRNTGLDSAGAKGDQQQPDPKGLERVKRSMNAHQSEHAMPCTIDHAQSHDGQVLAEEDVCDQRPEDGGEVDRSGKQVVILDRCGSRHRIAAAGPWHQEKELRHEDDQDPLHAVKTESFSRFIADDVWDPLGNLGGQGGRGEMTRRHVSTPHRFSRISGGNQCGFPDLRKARPSDSGV